jgi:hypothetical protein
MEPFVPWCADQCAKLASHTPLCRRSPGLSRTILWLRERSVRATRERRSAPCGRGIPNTDMTSFSGQESSCSSERCQQPSLLQSRDSPTYRVRSDPSQVGELPIWDSVPPSPIFPSLDLGGAARRRPRPGQVAGWHRREREQCTRSQPRLRAGALPASATTGAASGGGRSDQGDHVKGPSATEARRAFTR